MEEPEKVPAPAPKLREAIIELLKRDKYVSPVNLFVQLGMLRRRDLENWRAGRVASLELVILGNLTKLRRILDELTALARVMGLKPSKTAYKRKSHPLRFTRSGAPSMEARYSTHFVGRELIEAAQEKKRPRQASDVVLLPGKSTSAGPVKTNEPAPTWKKHVSPWAKPRPVRSRGAKAKPGGSEK